MIRKEVDDSGHSVEGSTLRDYCLLELFRCHLITKYFVDIMINLQKVTSG